MGRTSPAAIVAMLFNVPAFIATRHTTGIQLLIVYRAQRLANEWRAALEIPKAGGRGCPLLAIMESYP